MRTSREYADILKMVLKIQIDYIKNNPRYCDSELLQGQEIGLEIAIEKIDASLFLTEE